MKKITDSSSLDINIFFEKIKNAKKVLWFLGSYVFFSILVLIFLDVLFGGFLLYKYAILAKAQEPNTADKNFKFEESAYQEVLIELQTREEKSKSASEKNYLNPFKSKTSASGQPKLQ